MLGPRGWEEAWGWQEWLAGVIQGLEDYDWGMRWKLAPHGFVRLLWLVPFPLLMPSCEISSIALGRALVFGTLVTPWCHSTTTPFSCCSLMLTTQPGTPPPTPGTVMWPDLWSRGLGSPVGGAPGVTSGQVSPVPSWGLAWGSQGFFLLQVNASLLNPRICHNSARTISEKWSIYTTQFI